MKALVPKTFRSSAMLDGEDINDNLRAIADDVNRNLSRRYTYSTVTIELDGMANTDTSAARTITIEPPAAGGGNAFSVVLVELVVYAATGATWTCTVSDGSTPTRDISVATAGATVEAYASSDREHTNVDDVVLELRMAASAASTITRGSLILHLRCDRGVQGFAAHADYVPAFVDASTSSAGSVLDTQLTAAAAAVTTDATNAIDIRCECFVLRKTASALEWRIPSGAGRTAINVQGTIVADVGESATVAVTSGSMVLTGTGTANVVVGSFTHASRLDDPTDTADDTTVTITPAGGSVESCIVFVWWS